MTREGKAKKEEYQWEIKRQWKKEPIKDEVAINIIMYFDDARKHDWDNYHKLSMDACNGIVWDDDSQVVEAHVFKEYDKENPRIELLIVH
jgi:Holliday junction resolvase RusA-like endonuclease